MIDKSIHLRKDFKLNTKLFCEECKDSTDHSIVVLKNSPIDGGVPTLTTCLDCLSRYVKLDELGIESESATKFKRFLIDQWSWIVFRPKYLD